LVELPTILNCIGLWLEMALNDEVEQSCFTGMANGDSLASTGIENGEGLVS
jgi:hypothetical protein